MTKNTPSVKLDRSLLEEIKSLLQEARRTVARSINTAMVLTYFEIGRMIVEDEQQGKSRADYARETLKNLSRELNKEFGRGFSERNLENMRIFYLSYSRQISQTVSAKYETVLKIQGNN
jgi:hypothetical protein